MHLKAQCYYSLRELFGCATTKQHAASVSAGHAFVSETRDRVTVWTCLLQRQKAWQPLLSQVEPQKTLTCENYTRTSRSAALEKNKNKLRAEFIISTGKLCDDVDQTRGRLRWWGRVESLDVRDLDPPLQIWLFHSEGTLNVYSTILNWFTFKKKEKKEKKKWRKRVRPAWPLLTAAVCGVRTQGYLVRYLWLVLLMSDLLWTMRRTEVNSNERSNEMLLQDVCSCFLFTAWSFFIALQRRRWNLYTCIRITALAVVNVQGFFCFCFFGRVNILRWSTTCLLSD